MKPFHKSRTACVTCRQRKVKCSGERPKCRTCANSRRECHGYGAHAAGEQASSDAQAANRTNPGTQRRNLAKPVSARHGFRQQLLSLYLGQHLPDEIATRSNQDRNWLLRVPDLESLTPALETAVLASCAARLGRQDGNADLLHKSIVLYDISLRELRMAIMHPALRHKDQTLAACLALTMYEFTEGATNGTAGYLAHYKGAMELLRYRGPQSHASGFAHSVLGALRMHSIFNSFQQCSQSFLSRKDWLDLPWSSRPKDSHDHLLDIMLHISKTLTSVVDMTKSPSLPEILDAILQRVRFCWRLDARLTEWLEGLTKEIQGPLYWPEKSGEFQKFVSTDSDLDELFPIAYDFPSFNLAQTLILYWLSRTMVCYQLGAIYQKLKEFSLVLETRLPKDAKCICAPNRKTSLTPCALHFRPTQLPPLGFRSDWTRAAGRHICYSVGYFLQERMRCAGPACLNAPLLILRWHWQADRSGIDRAREIEWVSSILAKAYARGSRIAGFV
ncbi:hypothetical protein GQ53DRAFT_708006 [Thozetella sp. PMI_491]|nr:hypothetical protein GQ53DRAFT_708006 [Thozetella sp. PMI_491]